MDTEFWEQCDEIYREKLDSLQEELRMIQQGTHSAFQESLNDLEKYRDNTIEDALLFKEYEMGVVKQDYDEETGKVEAEYESERNGLMGVLLQIIEEKKKQVTREDGELDLDVFKDAYRKLNGRRNLRKTVINGRQSQSQSPSRHQERRSRRDRQATPHNIHAQPTSTEQEELEADFHNMKGDLSSSNLRKQR
ncbi:Sds3-like protein [Cokeromyces recurvatus]|uniref:Sds3-like protein n=1 Tax=Cokeromyces recurvatus TaxID=90255 RepID=UPI00221F7200|nr:Sds3-like protein [Cokeromyces recurvatus]KAI7900543.1 Sds3-like protein [Cokeromyces recurvatus]